MNKKDIKDKKDKEKLNEYQHKSQQVFGDKFTVISFYTKRKNVFIIVDCKDCNERLETRLYYFFKSGCLVCNGQKINKTTFVRRATKTHGDKYDYSKVVNPDGAKKKIIIVCNICGDQFTQRTDQHLKGHGCSTCAGNKKHTLVSVIKKSKEIHDNKYNYDDSTLTSMRDKTKILCNTCNKCFYQAWNWHINGRGGCFRCSYSIGEKLTMEYLDELKIDYEEQKTFADLKNKNNLFFDFYIPGQKIVFEFDGPQHREQNHFFNQEKFDYR